MYFVSVLLRSVRRVITVVSVALLVSSTLEVAYGQPDVQGNASRTNDNMPVDEFCDWVRSTAASESSILMTPEFLAAAGVVNGLILPDHFLFTEPISSFDPRLRLTVSAEYSLSDLSRGLAIRARARAECRRQRSIARLQNFVQAHENGQSRAALTAQLHVLEDALPRIQQAVDQVEHHLREHRATVVELVSAYRRAEQVRTEIARIQRELATLNTQRTPVQSSVGRDLRLAMNAEADIERQDAKIRRSRAWDLTLEGGYDQVFGVRDGLPLFGTVTFTFSPGLLFHSRFDRRAEKARLRWAEANRNGNGFQANQTLDRLRSLLKVEKSRLKNVNALVEKLNTHLGTLDAVSQERSRSLAVIEILSFDLAMASAEKAFLETHIPELENILGNNVK